MGETLKRPHAQQTCAADPWPCGCALKTQTSDLHDTVWRLRSFNQGVSHDLRGPLGAVSGVTRLAMLAIERRDTARALQLLSATALQTDALSRLVMELLALAEGDQLPEERIDLNQVVDEAIAQLALGAAAPLPRIAVQPLFFVRGSRVLLRQVFVNLLSNALKFTRDRSIPTIEVGVDAANVVFVRDNGIGFDTSAATLLFEPFQRLHPGGEHPGVGIGLSLVKRIVERHGGHVWAQAAPGEGASFYFSLATAE